MEDLAASLMMSPSHSAPLYLFYNVSAFPRNHGVPLHDGDGGFEFAAAAKSVDDSSAAAPRTCSSDVSAFADELFRGGVLLPLKLPPRLQRHSSSAAASAATSPTALAAKVPSRSPFATSARRHRGFDPFAAALEKVRRDGAAPAPRRARSLSPVRGAAAFNSWCHAGTEQAAQKARVAVRPPWRRRRGGVKNFLCRAVMASAAAAPKALRPRRRVDDDAPYRPGLLVCFGF